MTLPDADTTPLGITAALLKDAGVSHVLNSRSKSFEEYYEAVTHPFRMAGRDVAEPNDEDDELVRFARMRFAIIRCLLSEREPEEEVGGA